LRAERHPLCEHFLGWQCRIRQIAVRQGDGRPTSGMQPSLTLPDGGSVDAINVLILKREPDEYTARFQHIVRRTHDPKERLDEALKELAAAYYQRPYEFAETLTALFSLDSTVADALIDHGRCELSFEQFSQRYDLSCAVQALAESDAAFQATSAHNRMFNSTLPGNVRVVSFKPDWSLSSATPPIDVAG
jgi:hypothetical protein